MKASNNRMQDKIGQNIEIGDKFIRGGTTQIYEVIGFAEDGRIRAQEAILDFGGNPYAPKRPYGSTVGHIGPVYLFQPHETQINKTWGK